MAKKSGKTRVMEIDEMAEIEEVIQSQEQTVEKEEPDVDLEMSPEDLFRYTVHCQCCGDRIPKIGEIKVPIGFIRGFRDDLYILHCENCIMDIVQALEKMNDEKGKVVDIIEAQERARNFFRILAQQSELSDEFCIKCDKKPPVDDPKYWVIVSLPEDMWWEEDDPQRYYLRRLKGRRLCPFHARSARLAEIRVVRLEKYLEKEADAKSKQEAEEQDLDVFVQKYNERRGSLDYAKKNGKSNQVAATTG